MAFFRLHEIKEPFGEGPEVLVDNEKVAMVKALNGSSLIVFADGASLQVYESYGELLRLFEPWISRPDARRSKDYVQLDGADVKHTKESA